MWSSPEGKLIELLRDSTEWGHHDPRNDRSVLTDQEFQFSFKRIGERSRESREEDPDLRPSLGKARSAMKGDDGLSGAGRSRDAGWPREGLLHDAALRRMEKDRPLFPGVFERPLQLLQILYDTEPAQRVRVSEWIGWHRDWRPMQHASGRVLQQRFRSFGGKVSSKVEEAVL